MIESIIKNIIANSENINQHITYFVQNENKLISWFRSYLKIIIKDDPLLKNLDEKSINFIHNKIIDSNYVVSSFIYIYAYLIYLKDNKYSKFTNIQIDRLYRIASIGLIGYRIRDIIYDNQNVEYEKVLSLAASNLINRYYNGLILLFEPSAEQIELINEDINLLTLAEISEKHKMTKNTTKTFANEDYPNKSLMLFTPYNLFLSSIGKTLDEINQYRNLFINLVAPIQLKDDLVDLDEDITNGNFTYVHGIVKNNLAVNLNINYLNAIQSANTITSIFKKSQDHLEKAEKICNNLNDRFFDLIIQIKLLTLNKYYSKLIINIKNDQN